MGGVWKSLIYLKIHINNCNERTKDKAQLPSDGPRINVTNHKKMATSAHITQST